MSKWKPYACYKPSGIDWLGRIPDHWEIQKLKYIASVRFSNVDKHSKKDETSILLCNYVDVYYNECIKDNIEFMEATATADEISKFELREDDVLITRDSEDWNDIAVPAHVTSSLNGVLCGYHLALIRPDSSTIKGRYLFRAFMARGINDQFRVASNGITRYGLGKQSLDAGQFPVPPKGEQQSIAEFLDSETSRIDALIAKKNRLIELLNEKRAALITQAVTKGLDPNVPIKDSGIEWLGEIPRHWEVVRVRSLLSEVDQRSTSGEGELLTVSHITGVTRRSEKDVNMFLAETFEGYKKCEPDDLVINTMWAWMGALGVARESGIVSPSYNVYRFRQSEVDPRYYDRLFRTKAFRTEINRYSKGVWTSRLRLYPQEFFEILIPSPPLNEQAEISQFIEDQSGLSEKIIKKLEKSVVKLNEYRLALISAAVTGKIDVRQEVAHA